MVVFGTFIQQAVAYVIVAIFAVGAVVWLVASMRRARPEVGSEVELAPNRKPYYDDEGMEGKRLDAFGAWALVSITIIAVGLPLYWLAEPGRQAGAVKNFASEAAGKAFHGGSPVGGAALFATTAQGGFNCAGCHGGVSGGPVVYTLTDPVTKKVRQVAWTAPSLDDVALRMTKEQIKEVLTYGRPFSPMPAWGLLGGGALNDQQLDHLIAYLESVAITPKASKERQAAKAKAELAILQDPQAALAKAEAAVGEATDDQSRLAAEAEVGRIQAIIANKQTPSLGAALFNLNCSRCHTLGYSYGAPKAPGTGAFGPPLDNVLNQFLVEQDQIDFVTNGTKFGEKYGAQGKSSGRMPYFGQVLTADQIKAIVEYERELAQQRQQEK